MPTSGCCRRASAIVRRGAAGYTLIEMVVVLAIVSLLAGLAMPRLYRTYQAVTRQSEQDAIVAQLARLSLRANALGASFVLDTDSLGRLLPDGRPLMTLPAGWRLSMERPIHFNLIGVCDGGTVGLTAPDGETHTFTLQSPACEVREGAQTARL
jgi:prepilin-type N-terminal cleavage/methylation domain-containing protein